MTDRPLPPLNFAQRPAHAGPCGCTFEPGNTVAVEHVTVEPPEPQTMDFKIRGPEGNIITVTVAGWNNPVEALEVLEHLGRPENLLAVATEVMETLKASERRTRP